MRLPIAIACVVALHSTATAQQFVVAGPAELVAATKPLREHRAKQGLDVRVLDLASGRPQEVAAKLRDDVHARIDAAQAPGYLLLVGDIGPVPTLYRPGLRSHAEKYQLGAQRVPSDLGYVDIDDDGKPEWSCGRLPANTVAEVEAMVAKILAYEAPSDKAADWQCDVTLIANAGNFGAQIDRAIEHTVNQLFREDLSPWYRIRGVVGMETSPFYTAPDDFLRAVTRELNRGPFAAIYAGHGRRNSFASVQGKPVFRKRDVPELHGAHRSIVMAYACHIASFQHDCCLAEAMVRSPGGPVAVFAASEVSFPFGDLLLGHELMQTLSARKGELRIGDLIRKAKVTTLGDPTDPFHLRAEIVGNTLGLDERTRSGTRRYTSDLYHLLGDPALVLRLPREIVVALASGRAVKRGRPIEVVLTCRGEDGHHPSRVRVELCFDRGARKNAGLNADVLSSSEHAWDDSDELRVVIDGRGLRGRYAIVRVFAQDGADSWVGGLRFRFHGRR